MINTTNTIKDKTENEKKYKIVCTDVMTVTNGDVDVSALEKYGDVTYYDLTPPNLTAERIKDADMVLVNKTPIGRAEMDAASNLKYIGLFATGYNIIDTEYAREKGIVVCNAGQYSTNAVAQHTFALILELFSKVGEYSAFVENGGWKKSRIFSSFMGGTEELYGKTLGIIGFGSIGSAVAKIALAFGMRVLASTRTPKSCRGVEFVGIDTLFSESDIISLHCPLTKDTEKLINRDSLSKCRDGVYIINTSRGGTVDEAALADAVLRGKVAGAGLDVLDREPMASDCPLFGLRKVVITPHVAWAPLSTRQRLMEIVESNIRAFLDGRPVNVVNP